MQPGNAFLRFAAICSFISVITTLGIHLYFPDPPSKFEERVLLFRDKTYLINRWWVIFHCLLVIVSMCGIAVLKLRKSPGFIILGFIFFVVFGIAEIARQMYVLFYMNGLREQYYMSNDPQFRESMKPFIDNAGLLASPLFGLFIFSFGIGNLFYGLGLSREKRFGRLISVLLLFWACGTFLAFGNSFWNIPGINSAIEHYNYSYQPLVRGLVGIWLWKQANEQLGQRGLSITYI
jgi:hypothetical protein